VALIFIVSLSLGFIGGLAGSRVNTRPSSSGVSKVDQKVILNESQLISDIAKNVGPSVVSIDVASQSQQTDLFGFRRSVNQRSAGTGVILSKDGYILTNRHVIPENVNKVAITLSDGTRINDVDVVGRTTSGDTLDIAFLKVKDAKGKEFSPAKLGDSSQVRVGDKVIAIGNALGQFQNTVTSGIISGFGRSVQAGSESGGDTESLQNLFQTDAAINPGNSGGPLVNINGEVIGINTAVAGNSAQNIGFAIPINDTQGLIKSVLNTGKLQRPYLGVRYVMLTDDYAYKFNLSVKRGAYIAPSEDGSPSVIPGSPAEKAGLKEKDIITKVDNTKIGENNSLVSLVSRKVVGETVELTIIRDGQEKTIKVKLEAYKD
jgi:serine protease Do